MEMWLPIVLTVGPIAAGGFIAYGVVRSEIKNLVLLVAALDKHKASKELVNHQYEEIINRLGRIENGLKSGGFDA
jgi:hypothetical protein